MKIFMIILTSLFLFACSDSYKEEKAEREKMDKKYTDGSGAKFTKSPPLDLSSPPPSKP